MSVRLLEYLQAVLDNPGLTFAAPALRLTGGYDAAIDAVQLAGATPPFDRPLVLRVLQPAAPHGRVTKEATVQNALAGSGFPAPRVLLVEEDKTILGGAFLVMERVAGKQLGWEFEGLGAHGLRETFAMLRRFPQVRREIVRLWSEAVSRLECVPVAAFLDKVREGGVDPGSLSFESTLAAAQAAIARLKLDQLAPLFDWLAAQKPPETGPRVLCHGDLQPFNVMTESGRITGIIDWGNIVVADPALHYGGMLAIFATVPMRSPKGLAGLLRYFLVGLARSHTAAIRQERSASDLVYYGVFNAAMQLFAVSRRRAQGDFASGAYSSTAGMDALRGYIEAHTGIAIAPPV